MTAVRPRCAAESAGIRCEAPAGHPGRHHAAERSSTGHILMRYGWGGQSAPSPRQWDDWRCYRCNQWQRRDTPRQEHRTPVGLTLSICPACAAVPVTTEGATT